MDVLHPKKEDIMQAEISAGSGFSEVMNEAQFDARRTMNAMRTVGAALTRAIEEDRSSEVFSHLLNEAQRLARILLLKWGKNPEDKANRWMMNVVEKNLMPHLHPHNALSDQEVDVLAHQLAIRATDFPDHASFSDASNINLAVFRGLTNVWKAQNEYDFLRKSKEKDLEDVRDRVVQSATLLLEDLAPAISSHETRVVFLSMLIDQLFDIMVVGWNKNAQKAQDALKGFTGAQIKMWKQSNPEGFELKPVFDFFDQHTSRLGRLTAAVKKKEKQK